MIKKSLLLALGLLAAYTLLIQRFGFWVSRTAQTTAQRNLVKGEEYLYEAKGRYDTVIVGSSMSDRLVGNDSLRGLYNLSFAGQSSIEGLRLISQSGHVPKLIFVEINSLARQDPPEPELLNLTDPTQKTLKHWLPFLRQKYQPVGVFKALLRDIQHGRNTFVVPASALAPDTSLLSKTVAQLAVSMQTPIPKPQLDSLVRRAYTYLEPLRKAGAHVVFFEMPMDARLEQSALPVALRESVHRIFSTPPYTYIPLPPDAYGTTDGIHLLHPEAMRYTTYFWQQTRPQL